MDLNAALVFVRVIQSGSFSRAARQMDMPISTVSAKVAQLEKSLGVSLIQRSTRRLRLTDPGEIFFQHAVRAVSEMQQAEALTHEAQGAIQGKLRMTAPVEIGMSTLAESVSVFTAKHPKLHVELVLTDRMVDLIGEGIDLALRMGDLKDSSLMSKRLGETCSQGFASPAYLKKAPPLKKPQDLEKHDCLIFTNLREAEWNLEKGGVTQRVKVKGPVSANNLIAIHQVAVAGQGVALLPAFLCQEDVAKKNLVPVLEGWATRKVAVNLVFAHQSFMPRNTRALVDHLVENLNEVF